MVKVRITIDIEEEHLIIIDKAADLDFTSRNSLFVKGALKLSNKIIKV